MYYRESVFLYVCVCAVIPREEQERKKKAEEDTLFVTRVLRLQMLLSLFLSLPFRRRSVYRHIHASMHVSLAACLLVNMSLSLSLSLCSSVVCVCLFSVSHALLSLAFLFHFALVVLSQLRPIP